MTYGLATIHAHNVTT